LSAGPSSNTPLLLRLLLSKAPQLRRCQPSLRVRAIPCHPSEP
jgi:hypothetical protein